MRNLRHTTRTFHDEAIIIGSEQDTKSPEYQVRTRVHAHFMHKRIILKLISLRIPLLIDITLSLWKGYKNYRDINCTNGLFYLLCEIN